MTPSAAGASPAAVLTTRRRPAGKGTGGTSDQVARPPYDAGMARPFPVNPRGPRRRRPATPGDLLLGIPRVSPEWELGALRALMKPQAIRAVEHRSPLQPWPADAAARVESARRLIADRLDYHPLLALPPEGEYFLAMAVAHESVPEATALALHLSLSLPDVWIVFGRLFLKGGRFFRRQRGVKLNLVPATNIHLTRAIRAKMRRSAQRRAWFTTPPWWWRGEPRPPWRPLRFTANAA